MSTEVELNAFQERLRALEGQIVQLCASQVETDEFNRLFLEGMVSVLGVGGAIWGVDENKVMSCNCHMNLAQAGMDEAGGQQQLLSRALLRVYESGESVVLPGNDASNVYDGGLGKDVRNDSPHALLFVPFTVRKKVEAILLIISPTDVDSRAVRGYLGFILGLCERAESFLLQQEMHRQESQLGRSDRLRNYVSALHSSLDTKRTCYALVNYAQELLGVYRCMAGTFNSRGKFRMEAVSGLESVAVKSSFIQSIAEIARHVCRSEKVLLVDNPDAAARNEQVEEDDMITAARLYMLQAGSVELGIFPIRHQGNVVGALVVEKATEESFEQAQRQQVEALLVEAGSAMSNGLTYRNLPFSTFARPLGALRDKLYRMDRLRRGVLIALVLGVIVMPHIITKQVKVMGKAQLVPIAGRIVYAQQGGVIEDVLVPADGKVQKGQVLAVMDRRPIDSQIDQVTNAIAGLKLDQVEARNNRAMFDRIGYMIKEKQAELEKYQLQRKQFELISPVTGTVITRDSDIRQLHSRPLAQGEAVLEVVPQDTSWEFTVNIPEDQAGELLKAYKDLQEAYLKGQEDKYLKAKLILNAYPEMIFYTKVLSVAPRAYVLTTGQQEYRNVIPVRVAQPVDLREKIDPRQGLEGKVSIQCGRRSLFYALTHEFVDFYRVSMF